MNLLVITQYYYPEQFRVNDICEDMVKKGHSVTVLTGLPNYPHGEIYDGYQDKAGTVEDVNGVVVHRCKIYPRKQGGKSLALNYLSFAIYGSREIERIKTDFDIVFVYQMSPITMAIPAIRMCKKKQIPLALYCLDLWPASILDHNISRSSLIYKIVERISAQIYSKCDYLIVSSPSFKKYIADLCGIENSSIAYIPQHAEDIYKISENTTENPICNFMFLGNIGYSQNCECIIEAAQKIKTDKQFRIHFVGAGSKLEVLKTMVKQCDLEGKVVFHGFQKIDQLQQYYDIADVCILTLANDYEIGLTIPAKLQGYMAAGKPVVAAISGDAKTIIEDSQCGYCVESGDSDGLARAMKQMIDNREELIKMGMNARDYFEKNFSRTVVLDELETTLTWYSKGVAQ